MIIKGKGLELLKDRVLRASMSDRELLMCLLLSGRGQELNDLFICPALALIFHDTVSRHSRAVNFRLL